MKKFILGGVAIVALTIIAINVSTASEYEAALSGEKMECRWVQLTGYEGCLNGGDGNTCTCGATTRPIPETSDILTAQ
jgi:hypothetical protein